MKMIYVKKISIHNLPDVFSILNKRCNAIRGVTCCCCCSLSCDCDADVVVVGAGAGGCGEFDNDDDDDDVVVVENVARCST